MGSDISRGKNYQITAKFGQIFVQTAKSGYYPGETVAGNIYLNLYTLFPGNQLFIKLKGDEYAHFVDRETRQLQNGQTEFIDIHRKEKINHCSYRIPVFQWGTLNPGQYVFPFSFQLPPQLPATFFQCGNRYIADISYHIDAELQPFNFNESKLKYKQRFVIRDPIKQPIGQVSDQRTIQLTSCCCKGQGASTLSVTFEKNCYSPGEVAKVLIKLDNSQSSLDNTAINFSLNQQLTIRIGNHSFNRTFTVVQRSLGGVQKNQVSEQHYTELQLPTFQTGDFWAMRGNDLEKRLINETDPHGVINNSTHGRLVESRYFLDVKCPMDGCCVTAPEISVNTSIFFPDYPHINVSTPPNWSPNVMNSMTLNLSPQFQYTNPNRQNANVNVNFNANLVGMNTQMTTVNTQQSNTNFNFNGVNMAVSEYIQK